MPFILTMPKLSPTMEEGTLIKWHKKLEEFVHAGDLLIEVATDKATVEYYALDEGWLRQILLEEKENAFINQPIAILTVEQNELFEKVELSSSFSSSSEALPSKKEEQIKNNLTSEKRDDLKNQEKEKVDPLSFTSENREEESCCLVSTNKRIIASPLAKKLAKEKGLDLSTVTGSGPNRRIMSCDLKNASLLSCKESLQTDRFKSGSFEEIPLSQMRKTIGKRLQESKSFIPHFYVTQVVEAEALVALREQLKNQLKISVNDFIVKACATALKKHPEINTGFNLSKQSLIQFKTIDIAIAVSIEEGLITPIVCQADFKSIQELSTEIQSLVQRSREKKLALHEYTGGSFTVSNLGMHGVVNFQAILNPPQAAILAVGAIQDLPVIRQQQVVPGKVLHLTLSVDHRVIDGVAAALFLKTLKNLLENPAILLIN